MAAWRQFDNSLVYHDLIDMLTVETGNITQELIAEASTGYGSKGSDDSAIAMRVLGGNIQAIQKVLGLITERIAFMSSEEVFLESKEVYETSTSSE